VPRGTTAWLWTEMLVKTETWWRCGMWERSQVWAACHTAVWDTGPWVACGVLRAPYAATESALLVKDPKGKDSKGKDGIAEALMLPASFSEPRYLRVTSLPIIITVPLSLPSPINCSDCIGIDSVGSGLTQAQ
jgi:hypothetical protein